MFDLTPSARPANLHALGGVVRTPGGSSATWTGHVDGWPEFTSMPPMGWTGWHPAKVARRAENSREWCRGKFCSLSGYQLFQK
jgi:hypothetical protein